MALTVSGCCGAPAFLHSSFSNGAIQQRIVLNRQSPAPSTLFSVSTSEAKKRSSAYLKVQAGANGSKTSAGVVFVAGANGNTGKRIVAKLLSSGYKVRAGVLDIQKANSILPRNDNIEIVVADVTQEPNKLASLIGNADAVICSTGFRYSFDFLAPWKVDYQGTVNLVEACRKSGINKFILVSSILVNGAAWGQALNPAYLVLNAFGLTLIAKLQAENHIRKSGINYTIIRPGGLSNDMPSGNIVMSPEDTLSTGRISRDSVAEVAVEALRCKEAGYKVVEIVSEPNAPKKGFQELFASVP